MSTAQSRVDTALERQKGTKEVIGNTLTGTEAIAFVRGIAPGMDAKSLLLTAYAHVVSDPKLMRCEPQSILRSVAEAAALSLRCDGVLGQAYLIPYGRVAKMMMGYRGMVHRAYLSGKVTRVHADTIHTNDYFEYSEGVDVVLVHRPAPLTEERGDKIGAYAFANQSNGGPIIAAVLRPDAVARRRAASKTANSADSPWNKHEDAMWMKSAIRELHKRLPDPDLQTAALRDEAIDEGRSVPPSIDLGDAEVVGEEGAKQEAVPLSCGTCGRQDLRDDGTCHDCQPEQPE